jgi:hypothetical protein
MPKHHSLKSILADCITDKFAVYSDDGTPKGKPSPDARGLVETLRSVAKGLRSLAADNHSSTDGYGPKAILATGDAIEALAGELVRAKDAAKAKAEDVAKTNDEAFLRFSQSNDDDKH